MQAEVYDPDGLACEECGEKWRAGRARDATACPSCGSSRTVDAYPDIPDLAEEPGLALVLAVESQIPRAGSEGGGAILWRDAVAWLRFHGVRDRSEILAWEWFFREIAAIRGRILEELREPAPGKGEGEEREE